MNEPRKFLPDNLVCLDLPAGPFYLEHPKKEGTLKRRYICLCDNETP